MSDGTVRVLNRWNEKMSFNLSFQCDVLCTNEFSKDKPYASHFVVIPFCKKNGSRLAKLPVLSSKIEELYNKINISNQFYLKAIRRDGSSGGCCRMAIITKVVYLYYFIKLYCVIRVPVWVPFMEWIGSGTQLDIQLEEGGG